MDFWIKTYLSLGHLGATAVIVGVVLESAELFVKKMLEKQFRKQISRVLGLSGRRNAGALEKYIEPRILKLETYGFGLMVAGLAIELICTRNAEVMQSTQNLKLSAQIELMQSTNVVDERNVEAMRVENIAVSKQLKNSIKSELELEAALFPRIYAWNKLPYPGTKFAIVVRPEKADGLSEAQELSKQLIGVLFGSGWVVTNAYEADALGACPDGVTVIVRPASRGGTPSPSVYTSVEAARTLVAELRRNHIMVNFKENMAGVQHEDTVDILIGKKPDIYEIRKQNAFSDEAF